MIDREEKSDDPDERDNEGGSKKLNVKPSKGRGVRNSEGDQEGAQAWDEAWERDARWASAWKKWYEQSMERKRLEEEEE